jgi:prophage maintenance system killer protein
MKVLNLDQIRLFYSKIIDQTGGRKGIRDINLVEGALNCRRYTK